MIPPVIEGGYGNDGQIVHLERVRITGLTGRKPFEESEKIDAFSAFPQALQHGFRVLWKCILLAVDMGDADRTTLDFDVFATNPDHFRSPLDWFHRKQNCAVHRGFSPGAWRLAPPASRWWLCSAD